ncbi:uncharacterized protein NPIL_571161 [Nephila pilipes]|uniref:CWH43-like N-terminal domain-containing protein n=1 Tax=Nephila pilipes TaxID=299642 RepID=A0A8X6I984_NEPPI|nr:uncharacterized protein NPIL_571161 [Nephila pilipes]
MTLSNSTYLLNKLSVLPGISSFAGLLFVAAFPSTSKQKVVSVNAVGSYMFFTLGLLFSFMQTITTFMYSRFSKLFLTRMMFVMIIAGSYIGAVTLTEQNKSQIFFPHKNETLGNETTILFITDTKGINSCALAFGLERVFVFGYIMFFLTFFLEFQKISTYVILRPTIISPPNDYSSSCTVNERV